MCQAIPRKVVAVDGDRVEVLVDGVPQAVNAFGMTDLQPGEYVVVYTGAVIQRVSEDEANEILEFLAEMEALFEGDPRPGQRALP